MQLTFTCVFTRPLICSSFLFSCCFWLTSLMSARLLLSFSVFVAVGRRVIDASPPLSASEALSTVRWSSDHLDSIFEAARGSLGNSSPERRSIFRRTTGPNRLRLQDLFGVVSGWFPFGTESCWIQTWTNTWPSTDCNHLLSQLVTTKVSSRRKIQNKSSSAIDSGLLSPFRQTNIFTQRQSNSVSRFHCSEWGTENSKQTKRKIDFIIILHATPTMQCLTHWLRYQSNFFSLRPWSVIGSRSLQWKAIPGTNIYPFRLWSDE